MLQFSCTRHELMRQLGWRSAHDMVNPMPHPICPACAASAAHGPEDQALLREHDAVRGAYTCLTWIPMLGRLPGCRCNPRLFGLACHLGNAAPQAIAPSPHGFAPCLMWLSSCRYEGLTSPYIYPLYGLGELPQVGQCSAAQRSTAQHNSAHSTMPGAMHVHACTHCRHAAQLPGAIVHVDAVGSAFPCKPTVARACTLAAGVCTAVCCVRRHLHAG